MDGLLSLVLMALDMKAPPEALAESYRIILQISELRFRASRTSDRRIKAKKITVTEKRQEKKLNLLQYALIY